MAKTIILHTQGNEITIAFPIEQLAHFLTDGDTNIDVVQWAMERPVWVILSRGLCKLQYKASVTNNYVMVTDHGHIPCGEYDIEVRFDNDDGLHMRFKQEKVLAVVDTTEAGRRYESTDYDVMAYYPVIHGRASAVVIGDNYVGLYSGLGLNADIGTDSVNLRAGYGNSQVEVTENNVNININEE